MANNYKFWTKLINIFDAQCKDFDSKWMQRHRVFVVDGSKINPPRELVNYWYKVVNQTGRCSIENILLSSVNIIESWVDTTLSGIARIRQKVRPDIIE